MTEIQPKDAKPMGIVQKLCRLSLILAFLSDLILSEDDWALVDKAEVIARASIGLPPLDRPSWTTVGRLLMDNPTRDGWEDV